MARAYAPWQRAIKKPVAGTVRLAVDGAEQAEATDFSVDATTGLVTFLPGHVPGAGAVDHRRLRVRCAGALRHRQARDQSAGISPPERSRTFPSSRCGCEGAYPPSCKRTSSSGATTLCWCWRLTRRDGIELGFTDHDRDVTFDGTTFEAAAGFTATEMRDSVGLSVDNLEVTSALTSSASPRPTSSLASTMTRASRSSASTGGARAAHPDALGLHRRGAARGRRVHRRGARASRTTSSSPRGGSISHLRRRPRRHSLHGRSRREPLSRHGHDRRDRSERSFTRERPRPLR